MNTQVCCRPSRNSCRRDSGYSSQAHIGMTRFRSPLHRSCRPRTGNLSHSTHRPYSLCGIRHSSRSHNPHHLYYRPGLDTWGYMCHFRPHSQDTQGSTQQPRRHSHRYRSRRLQHYRLHHRFDYLPSYCDTRTRNNSHFHRSFKPGYHKQSHRLHY
jgi:hypothetical protein